MNCAWNFKLNINRMSCMDVCFIRPVLNPEFACVNVSNNQRRYSHFFAAKFGLKSINSIRLSIHLEWCRKKYYYRR